VRKNLLISKAFYVAMLQLLTHPLPAKPDSRIK